MYKINAIIIDKNPITNKIESINLETYITSESEIAAIEYLNLVYNVESILNIEQYLGMNNNEFK